MQLKNKIEENRNYIENAVWEENDSDYKLPTIEIHNSDFKNVPKYYIKYDWSDATIAFVSSTCYSPEVMKEVVILSQKMKKGTIFVTLTQKLDITENYWKVVEQFEG